ncbi:MAG TPA: hypothetical protein VJP86_12490, partial [Vicinamibacterales bacterium]|nr:hypothetical protein [Vicinamibacterales bacterium]
RLANPFDVRLISASRQQSVVPIEELAVLRDKRPNVLITGAEQAVAALLDQMRPLLQGPLTTVHVNPDRLFDIARLPRHGTVIIRNLSALCAEDQRRLHDWLTQVSHDTQVVATSSNRLFAMVAEGAFLDVLYYRLNTLYFEVQSH